MPTACSTIHHHPLGPAWPLPREKGTYSLLSPTVPHCPSFSPAAPVPSSLSPPPIVSFLFQCRLPAVTGKGMTPPQKILFPPEKICMDWRQKRRPGAGLYNLGSTCYLNVILQCLTYTPPLANYLLSRQHSRFCESCQKYLL